MLKSFVLRDLSFWALCLLLLTACGGGGSGNNSNDSPQNPAPAFSLESNSIAFTVTAGYSVRSGMIEFEDVSYMDRNKVTITEPAGTPGWLVDARVGQVNPGSPSPRLGIDVIVNPYYMTLGNHRANFTVAVQGRGSRDIGVSVLAIKPIQLDQTRFQTDLIHGAAGPSQWTVDHTLTADASTRWSASSGQSWVNVLPASGVGGATIRSTVNIGGLGVGNHVANVEFKDGDYPYVNSVTVSHVVNIAAPELTVPDEITINGPLGIGEETEQSLQFSINTGTVQHPYTLSFANDDNENWLHLSQTAGTVAASGQTIQLTAADNLESGSYEGTLTLSVNVNGYMLVKQIAVAFNKEANRVVVQSNGVSFLQSPSRSLLTKVLKVQSSLGRNNTPWQAISDQAWLSATPSGVTGNSLTLTANTSGLTPGAYYSATVEVRSSDPAVTDTETIQVGLQYLSSDPASISLNIPEVGPDVNLTPHLVNSPVESLAFVAVRNQILAYNLYTGVLERSFVLPGLPVIKGMAISSDGQHLYVYSAYAFSSPGRLVLEVNAQTGNVVDSFEPALPHDNPPDILTPGYVRPAGIPHLVNIGAIGINLADKSVVSYGGTHAIWLREYSVHPGVMDPTTPMRSVQPNGQVLDLIPSSLFQNMLYASAANTPYPSAADVGACLSDPAAKVFTGDWSSSQIVVFLILLLFKMTNLKKVLIGMWEVF